MNTNNAKIHKLVMNVRLNNNLLINARKQLLDECNNRNYTDDEWVEADNLLIETFYLR